MGFEQSDASSLCARSFTQHCRRSSEASSSECSQPPAAANRQGKEMAQVRVQKDYLRSRNCSSGWVVGPQGGPAAQSVSWLAPLLPAQGRLGKTLAVLLSFQAQSPWDPRKRFEKLSRHPSGTHGEERMLGPIVMLGCLREQNR